MLKLFRKKKPVPPYFLFPPYKNQKFQVGTLVFITKDIPQMMRHFEHGLFAIVHHSGAQSRRDYNPSSNSMVYSLVLLNERGEPFEDTCWYGEELLSYVSPPSTNTYRKLAEFLDPSKKARALRAERAHEFYITQGN